MFCINISDSPIVAPNCDPTDVINCELQLTDNNGLIATITLEGTLENINNFSATHPLRLVGSTGSYTQNSISITETFPSNFEFYEAIVGALSVIDCKGISSVTPFVDTLTMNDTDAVDDLTPIQIIKGTTINIAPNLQGNDIDNQNDNQSIISINGHNVTNNQPTIINGFIIELTPLGELNFAPQTNTPIGQYSFTYLIQDDNVNPAQDTAQFIIELVNETVEGGANSTNAVDDPTPIKIDELQTTNILPLLKANDFDLELDNQVVTHVDEIELQIGTPVVIKDVEFVKVSETVINATPNAGSIGTINFTYSIEDDGSPIATDTANFSIQVTEAIPANTTDAVDDPTPIQIEELQTINLSPLLLINDVDPENHNQVVTHIDGIELQIGTPVVIKDVEFVKVSDTVINATPQSAAVGTIVILNYSIEDNGIPVATDTANFYIDVTPAIVANTTDAIDDTPISIEEIQTINISPLLLINDVDPENHNQVVTHVDGIELQIGTPVVIKDVEFVKVSETVINATPQMGSVGTINFTYSIEDDGSPIATDTANFSFAVTPTNSTDAIDDTPISIEEIQTINISPLLLINDVDPENHNQVVTHIDGTELQLGTPVVIKDVEFVKVSDTVINATPNAGSIGTINFTYSIEDDGTPVADDTANFSIDVTPAPQILHAGILIDESNEKLVKVTTYGTHYTQAGVAYGLEDSIDASYRDYFQVNSTVMFWLESVGGGSANSFTFSNYAQGITQEDKNLIESSFQGVMGINGYYFNDQLIHGIAVKIGLITKNGFDNNTYNRSIFRQVNFNNQNDFDTQYQMLYPYITFQTDSNFISIDSINDGHIVEWGDGETSLIHSTILHTNIEHTYVGNIEEGIIWGNITSVDFDDCNLSSLDMILISNSIEAIKAENNNLNSLEVGSFSLLIKLWVGGNNISSLNYHNLLNLRELTINYNLFTSIDVTNLTELYRLSLSGNQISVLDVSQNTKLTQLYCSDNSILQLDLSNQTLLTNLSCNNNQISDLSSLEIITSLVSLSANNNDIGNLDVSNLVNLELLHLNNCGISIIDITDLALMENIALADNSITNLNFSSMNTINYINIKDLNLTGGQIEPIVNSLLAAQSSNAGTLYINGNNAAPSNLTSIQTLIDWGWTVFHN